MFAHEVMTYIDVFGASVELVVVCKRDGGVGFGGWLRVQRVPMHSVRAGQNCSSGAEGCLVIRERLGPLEGPGINV